MNTLQSSLAAATGRTIVQKPVHVAVPGSIVTLYKPGTKLVDTLNCERHESGATLAPCFYRLRVTGANPKIQIADATGRRRWIEVK